MRDRGRGDTMGEQLGMWRYHLTRWERKKVIKSWEYNSELAFGLVKFETFVKSNF